MKNQVDFTSLKVDDDLADIAAFDDIEEQELEKRLEQNQTERSLERISTNSPGFREFLLKPELMKAIEVAGFEHPSAIQCECIPAGIL